MKSIALAVAIAAIGDTRALSPALQCALNPAAFEPMRAPGPNDWLANHTEAGQTFDDFVRSQPNRLTPQRRTIYLQPLGTFELGPLKEFTEAFFMMPVVVRAPIDLATARITSRKNPNSGQQQLLTTDILGQASLRDRVGVYSFARYQGQARRSCKVIAHETSHMFGIEHCIFFRCVINGSNHLAESDARPMHLCPVDLRKLQWSVGFDVIERYRRLRAVCERAGFTDEARWCEREIERCGK